MVDVDSNSIAQARIGLLGGSSLVGVCLLPMLCEAGAIVANFSRKNPGPNQSGVEWRPLTGPTLPVVSGEPIHAWVCLAPIWVLPHYFELLEAYGAKRVVALSSTSIFTKHDSNDPQEYANAKLLAEGERKMQEWATRKHVEWVILRPTLIYDLKRDKNISEIARFIARFGFFPIFGKANGLRQPIHAGDVADACLAALQRPAAANHAYNISGGETLTYRSMVDRIFHSLGRRPLLLRVPFWAFRLAMDIARYLPRYKLWSTAMVERMCIDLVFDHAEAARDLAFKPRSFVLAKRSLPP